MYQNLRQIIDINKLDRTVLNRKTMNSKIIDSALDFVKEVFSSDFSGHDYFHTLRVYKMAVRIA